MAGTQRTIAYLEGRFETGDIPTQQDFYDLFVSFLHYQQIVQNTGASETNVMSQKAVSDALAALTGGVVIAATYADIAAMLAAQGAQTTGKWYMVQNATADPTVSTGWAIYQKLAATTGALSDYQKIMEQESMDGAVVVNPANETTQGIAEIATQAEVNAGTDDARIVTALKLKNRDRAIGALTNAATTDINSDKWTWAISQTTRGASFSFVGEFSEGVITLTNTTCVITFPVACLCVSEGIASGDNTATLNGISGDKYFVSIKKMGSAYYVVVKNFGQ